MAENEYTKKHRSHGVPMQVIHDCGFNVFALKLLVESYTNHFNPIPVTFPFMGVEISLRLIDQEGTKQS